MIRILATALLALSLTASAAFATSMDDLVERDGLYYKKFTDKPFTGVVDEGKRRGAFKNGEQEGPWLSYYENGQLSTKGAFKNGEQEGPWLSYYENGQLSTKGAFKNGEQEGPWLSYYENGQLYSKGAFKNGKWEGPWLDYWENGQLMNKGAFKNGKEEGPWVYYWKNGQLSRPRARGRTGNAKGLGSTIPRKRSAFGQGRVQER
jgi:antitoxin component YwqK of YwqJK toxin-antitoxin module